MGEGILIMTTDTAADVKQTRVRPSAFIVALIFCVFLVIIFAALAFAKGGLVHKIELQGRINPNDASAASLVRLPGIGISRAQAIVAFRQEHTAKDGQGPAFKDCNDLDKVKGIGPATVRKIDRWLEFK